jgi:hypothetical protein
MNDMKQILIFILIASFSFIFTLSMVAMSRVIVDYFDNK